MNVILSRLIRNATIFGVCAFTNFASAGPGHDHGDAPALPGGAGYPRFEAHSELFEMVGIVKGKTIELYLDDFHSNAPILKAAIQIELQPQQGAPLKLVAATPSEDGVFTIALPKELATGAYAVTATIRTERGAKGEDDLLSGKLDLHGADKAGAESPSHQNFSQAIGLGSALAAVLVLIVWFKKRGARARRMGGLS